MERNTVTLIICPDCKRVKKHTNWVEMKNGHLCKLVAERDVKIILDVCPKCFDERKRR